MMGRLTLACTGRRLAAGDANDQPAAARPAARGGSCGQPRSAKRETRWTADDSVLCIVEIVGESGQVRARYSRYLAPDGFRRVWHSL